MEKLSEQLIKADALSEEIRPILIACEKFTSGLNSKPRNVKKRQNISYLPISEIEAQLDRMYAGLWQTKGLTWKVSVNEIVVSLELGVFHPIAKTWIWRCGVGAAMIRQNKGAAISDINAKIKNALEADIGHAKADAIKNAAKSLGDLFGRNVARKPQDVSVYSPILLDKIKKLGNE